MGGKGKYDHIGTFVDPSKIGVVQFKSIASKIGFLRRSNNIESKWLNGQSMRFKGNDSVEKRISDKKLGFVKYYLHQTEGHPLANVRSKWKKGEVELLGKKVAWVTETGQLAYADELTDIAASVDERVQSWKTQRGME